MTGSTRHGFALAAIALAAALWAAAAPAAGAAAGTTARSGSANIRPVPRPDCTPPPDVAADIGRSYDPGNPARTLDVYHPKQISGEPAVVMIHGGGWRGGSSAALCKEAAYFAQNGIAAFSVNYTLSEPDKPSWPVAYADVAEAMAWISANAAAEYDVDGSRLAAFGSSAGGHLASLLDTRGGNDGPAVTTTVTLSGPMDLTAPGGNRNQREALREFLGCRPVDCPATAADASPVTWVNEGDAPMLIFHSSAEDLPVEQAREMSETLTAAGVFNRLVEIKADLHAVGYECKVVALGGEKRTVLDHSVAWIGTRLLRHEVTPTGTFCS